MKSFHRGLLAISLLAFIVISGCARDETGPDATNSGTGPRPQAQAPAEPAAAADVRADRPVDAETLPYAEVDEELVYGHFAFPSDMIEPLPAIIIVHDWWGLNDDARAAASRLAAQGYMVLAVDLYGGEIAPTLEDARARMIRIVENSAIVEDNLRQALDFVDIAGAPMKATLGWGMGGNWALNSAILFPDRVDAAVVFYGQVTDDEERLRTIEAPVLGFFGARDRGITIDTVRDFEQAMQRLRKSLTLEIYDEVGHAFADPARTNYSPDIAEDAWQKTIDFLATNLAVASES